MCSEPLTLGGGMTIVNGGLSLAASAVKYPRLPSPIQPGFVFGGVRTSAVRTRQRPVFDCSPHNLRNPRTRRGARRHPTDHPRQGCDLSRFRDRSH